MVSLAGPVLAHLGIRTLLASFETKPELLDMTQTKQDMHNTNFYCRPVNSQDFSWFQDLFLQISLCPKFSCNKKEKGSLYWDQTSSFLFVVMWRVCKSSQEVRGKLFSWDQNDTQACYPFFTIFYFFQITVLVKHACKVQFLLMFADHPECTASFETLRISLWSSTSRLAQIHCYWSTMHWARLLHNILK